MFGLVSVGRLIGWFLGVLSAQVGGSKLLKSVGVLVVGHVKGRYTKETKVYVLNCCIQQKVSTELHGFNKPHVAFAFAWLVYSIGGCRAWPGLTHGHLNISFTKVNIALINKICYFPAW